MENGSVREASARARCLATAAKVEAALSELDAAAGDWLDAAGKGGDVEPFHWGDQIMLMQNSLRRARAGRRALEREAEIAFERIKADPARFVTLVAHLSAVETGELDLRLDDDGCGYPAQPVGGAR
jgi:hypothetical protein